MWAAVVGGRGSPRPAGRLVRGLRSGRAVAARTRDGKRRRHADRERGGENQARSAFRHSPPAVGRGSRQPDVGVLSHAWGGRGSRVEIDGGKERACVSRELGIDKRELGTDRLIEVPEIHPAVLGIMIRRCPLRSLRCRRARRRRCGHDRVRARPETHALDRARGDPVQRARRGGDRRAQQDGAFAGPRRLRRRDAPRRLQCSSGTGLPLLVLRRAFPAIVGPCHVGRPCRSASCSTSSRRSSSFSGRP